MRNLNVNSRLRPTAAFMVVCTLLAWTLPGLATTPRPPAQIVLAPEVAKDAMILESKTLPFRIKVNQEGVNAVEITATQREVVSGKLNFDQTPAARTAEVLMQLRETDKKQLEAVHQLSLKVQRPGTYIIDIRIKGRVGQNAGFSNRLIRYVIVDEKGTQTLLSPVEFMRRENKAREQQFMNENQKNPKNHPIRLLFGDTVKVPPFISERIQRLQVPKEHQMEVRPEGPSEFLRKHSVDHTSTSWSSQDNITIRGRVVFQDFDGIWKPLVNVSVNLWDADFLVDENLGVVATDWNGNWSFTVNDDDGWFQDGRDIYYTFKLENTRLSTSSCSFLAGAYQWQSAVHNDLPDGTVLDFGDETASDHMEALQVWNTLNLAWNHAVGVGGWDPGKIDSCYPHSGTFYDGKVNVDTADNDGPDSITHEYGHGLMAHAYSGGDPSPGGDHGFDDCNQNHSLSWSEGWATGFMLSARPDGTYNWHEGDGGRNIENFSSTCHLGESSEGRVAGALLDMFDSNNDDNGGDQDRGRNGNSDHNTGNTAALATMLRDTMVGSHHNDVLEFWNSLSGELNSPQRSAAHEIMFYNWMSVTDPTSCVATKVATQKEPNPEPLLAGLRKFRDLALKNWAGGRDLINIYYRNSPEIGLALLEHPEAVSDALLVMKHFAAIGGMTSQHAVYLRAMAENPPAIPDDVAASIERVLQVLEQKASPQLKEDILSVRKNLVQFKGMHLQELQDYVTRLKQEQKSELPGVRQNQFSPASQKALEDERLKGIRHKSVHP